jgi:hypothetical protein
MKEMFDLDDEWMHEDEEQIAEDEEFAAMMAEVDEIERMARHLGLI